MLRTCNVLRIASVPVLRNDGAPERRTPRTARDVDGASLITGAVQCARGSKIYTRPIYFLMPSFAIRAR
ncbi:MAG: hypothetical protein LBM98_03395 [Oscillospiraceae bacterium]|nr:hypothetical protein [Oscillospiraceae bacterium]